MLVIYTIMGAIFEDELDFGVTEFVMRPRFNCATHAHISECVWIVPGTWDEED